MKTFNRLIIEWHKHFAGSLRQMSPCHKENSIEELILVMASAAVQSFWRYVLSFSPAPRFQYFHHISIHAVIKIESIYAYIFVLCFPRKSSRGWMAEIH